MQNPDILNQIYPSVYHTTYDQIFTYDNIYNASIKCANGVRWKRSTQNFLLNPLSNPYKIYEAMNDKSFRSKGFNHFTINERGKERDINAVYFDEKIVQKVISDLCLRPSIIPRLIPANCATLPCRGTQAAINHLIEDLTYSYNKYGPECYIMIMDYHAYYDSVNHIKLLEMMDKWIKDKDLFDLISYFILQFRTLGGERKQSGLLDSYDVEDIIFLQDNILCNNDLIDGLVLPNGAGLGLGSEISQLSGISYTNKIDHIVVRQYNIPTYCKYMDDSYMISNDINKLKECFSCIQEESAKINLTYNMKHTKIYKITNTFYFLKKKIRVDTNTGKIYIDLSDEAKAKHRRIIKDHYRLIKEGRMTFEDVFNCYLGWRGTIRYMNTFEYINKLNSEFCYIFREYINTDIRNILFSYSNL